MKSGYVTGMLCTKISVDFLVTSSEAIPVARCVYISWTLSCSRGKSFGSLQSVDLPLALVPDCSILTSKSMSNLEVEPGVVTLKHHDIEKSEPEQSSSKDANESHIAESESESPLDASPQQVVFPEGSLRGWLTVCGGYATCDYLYNVDSSY